MSYFRLRVELAYIQGAIYDLLYSNRAAKVDAQERQRRVMQIQAKLDNWYERIPVLFQIDVVSSSVGPIELVLVTKMHHGYLIAKVMAHGFYSKDAKWIKGESTPDTVTMNDLVLTQDKFGAARGNTSQDPPSPLGWQELVQISRGFIKLFHAANEIESLIW
jgi:hypothetical protein